MNIRKTLLIISALVVTLATHAQYSSYPTQCEDTCRHIHGLDISHYQGSVFWNAIGENSKQFFVYLKASEGGDNIDQRYKDNIDMARACHLKVGSYHFYRPRRPQEEQLRNFRAQCRPEDQDLIPMIDVEVNAGLGRTALCDSLHKFLKLVEKEYGQKPILYTYTSFYNQYLYDEFDDYLLWIAQYNKSTNKKEPQLRDERDIFAWQYTEKGRIDGVTGYVDKNRLLGNHSMREIRFRHNRTSRRR